MQIEKLGLNPSILLTFDKHEEHIDFSDNKKYIYLQGRAISSSLLKGSFYIDFTKENVLKNSVEKLINKPVFANHDKDVSKWIGKVALAEWDEESNPKGINFRIKMPSLDNPNATEYSKSVAKGIMEEIINSFSVGVVTKLSMSHPEMELEEFILKQGQEIDGQIVRMIVDEINDYLELSVVYEGRDPNAKLTKMFVNNSFSKDDELTKEDLLKLLSEEKKNNSDKDESQTSNLSLQKDKDEPEIIKGENSEMEEQNVKVQSESNNIQQEFTQNLNKQDQLQKQMSDMLYQMNNMKSQIDEYQKINLNLKQKLEEEKLSNQNISQNFKYQDYNHFKEKYLEEGLIFKDQLMLDDDGIEHLEKFYLSLNEEQLLLFKTFVKNSPVKTLLELSKKPVTKEEKEVSVAKNHSRSEYIGRKISDYAKNNNMKVQDIYSNDNLYDKLTQEFEKEYIRNLEI